ncbi:MAG TPA: hypothetical protein VF017_16325 [Thermoanaerobaculia bacterium]|nr:hypothetical protein [Thermoanaerobaculia bacterium]
MSPRPAILSVLVCLGLAPPASPQTPIFLDGFESGNTLAWSLSVGEPPLLPATVLRISDLDLRDPHVFAPVPVVGCWDFTDQALPFGLGPSFNEQLATSITTDGDGDTFLDLSLLHQFRPYDALAASLRLDVGQGLCTAPVAGTNCAPDPSFIPRTTVYDGFSAGPCLGALAGTTSGYTPAVATIAPPCFVSQPAHHSLPTGTLILPLRGLQLSATLGATPGDPFPAGLLRGFLRESDAAGVLLPAELPIVGGQPITVLLPGGQGSCAAGDDRDLFEGVSGWWFYLAYTAEPVPWAGS